MTQGDIEQGATDDAIAPAPQQPLDAGHSSHSFLSDDTKSDVLPPSEAPISESSGSRTSRGAAAVEGERSATVPSSFGPTDVKQHVMLRIEWATQSEVKTVNRLIYFAMLCGLAALITYFVIKVTSTDTLFIHHDPVITVNIVVGCINACILFVTIGSYMYGCYCARATGLKWSERRRKLVTLFMVELCVHLVNTAFFVVPNVYFVTVDCSWAARLHSYCAWFRLMGWYTLFVTSIMHAINLMPWNERFLTSRTTKMLPKESHSIFLDAPWWIHTPALLVLLPAAGLATAMIVVGNKRTNTVTQLQKDLLCLTSEGESVEQWVAQNLAPYLQAAFQGIADQIQAQLASFRAALEPFAPLLSGLATSTGRRLLQDLGSLLAGGGGSAPAPTAVGSAAAGGGLAGMLPEGMASVMGSINPAAYPALIAGLLQGNWSGVDAETLSNLTTTLSVAPGDGPSYGPYNLSLLADMGGGGSVDASLFRALLSGNVSGLNFASTSDAALAVDMSALGPLLAPMLANETAFMAAANASNLDPNDVNELIGLSSMSVASQCDLGSAMLWLSSVIVGSWVFLALLFLATVAAVKARLARLPYVEHRLSNTGIKLMMRDRAVLFTFVSLSASLLWFADYNSCNSLVLSYFGFLPAQIVTSVSLCLMAFLHMPITPRHGAVVQTWLQEFNWSEQGANKVPVRKELQGAALFCFETAVKAFYWSALVYDLEQVPGSPYNISTAMALTDCSQYALLWEKGRDTKCLLAWGPRTIVLAFRGTDSTANVKSDLQFLLEPHAPVRGHYWSRPRVHQGFQRSWRSRGFNRQVLDHVTAIIRESGVNRLEPFRVLCVGHSLGGALATLAAFDVAHECREMASLQLACYPVGAARTGNHAFAKDFDAHVPNCFHLVNDQDMVVRSGKLWCTYKRGSSRTVIDTKGNLIVRPSFLEMSMHQNACGGSFIHHLLDSYRASLKAVILSQFTTKGSTTGKMGIVRMAESPAMRQVLQDVFDLDPKKLQLLANSRVRQAMHVGKLRSLMAVRTSSESPQGSGRSQAWKMKSAMSLPSAFSN